MARNERHLEKKIDMIQNWIRDLRFKRELCLEKKKRDLKVQAILQLALSNAESNWQKNYRLLQIRKEKEIKRKLEKEDAKEERAAKKFCQENDPQNDKVVADILQNMTDFLTEVKNYSSN